MDSSNSSEEEGGCAWSAGEAWEGARDVVDCSGQARPWRKARRSSKQYYDRDHPLPL